MASKLKDLKITKVDFVEAGANPEANILLFKNKEGKPGEEPVVKTQEGGEKEEGVVRKFLSAIAKALGVGDEEVDEAIGEITKGYEASTFGEKMEERQKRRITSEIWDVCFALEESLSSIILDEEAEDKQGLLTTSLDEFAEALKELIPTWATGKETKKISKAQTEMTKERLEIVKEARQKLDDIIAKAEPEAKEPENTPGIDPEGAELKKEKSKGDEEDMKIDKSKLTPEELAALEAIEKKAGVQEEAKEDLEGVAKSQEPEAKTGEGEDIYKGLHPAVKEELTRLRKAADAAEERELTEIAKKYEIIGKKSEELVPLFKSLKAAGGDAYNQMIAVLDASVTAVEKSGVFEEIGKKGHGESDAWTAIEKHADEIQKSMPELSRAEAIDKACQRHPELVHEYENQQ